MSTVSFHIANLLEKMTSSDKDFRFMATNDLMSELQKDSIKLDDDSEKKVVRMLLKLLEDKNGEVQNLAVKCLGPLVAKVKEAQVETIVGTLCTNMTGEKEQLRDISSIGLKTVITELPLTSQHLASVICKKIIGKLTIAISKQEDVTVQLEALDILGDLLLRFGPLLAPNHSALFDALFPQLHSGRQAVRKRTVVALGYLAASTSSAAYHALVVHLLGEMRRGLEGGKSGGGGGGGAGGSEVGTFIQAVGVVCRSGGGKFGEHLDEVVRLLLAAVGEGEDDELKENTLQAFEIFVSRCPVEMGSLGHLESILSLCTTLIAHDPNYNDDESGGGGGGNGLGMSEESMDTTTEEDEEGGGGDEEEEEEEDEYSDDDDMSWKVRRGAAKCIEAVITSRPDYLLYVYEHVAGVLVLRFREREENVRSDVFSAYRALLRATKPAVVSLSDSQHTGLPPPPENSAAVAALQAQIPQLVKVVQRQLKEKNIRSRQVALQLLGELVGVLPGCLAPYLASMMSGIVTCLTDRSSSSNLKTSTLSFLSSILSSHSTPSLQPHLPSLLPPLLAALSDSFYKVTSEALGALQLVIRVVKSGGESEMEGAESVAREIYGKVVVRLRATDIDQEVKETAITTMGVLFAHLGCYIVGEWSSCVPIFLDRLKNEITRLTTVKALNFIASSQLVKLDMGGIIGESLPLLASFLRKNQRALKLATLALLDTLVKRYGELDGNLLESVIVELPPLLSESDLHSAQQTLLLMSSLATHQPHMLERTATVTLPSIKILVRSSLMQGGALSALCDFLRSLVLRSLPPFTPTALLSTFLENEKSSTPSGMGGAPLGPSSPASSTGKQSYYSLAKCIAVVSVGGGRNEEGVRVGRNFIADLRNGGGGGGLTDGQVIIALLSIGEIGRFVDLSHLEKLEETILSLFSHPSEEVKTAAAYSYGSLAIGNLEYFLPALLREMEAQPKKQYLLLHSLKEIISAQQSVNIKKYTGGIWAALFAHAKCPEEGTRNVVAECLGRLTLASPLEFLPQLKAALNSPSPLLRTTVVTAVKFTIVDQPQSIDPILRESIGDFLKSLADEDLSVRRVALVAFNSAAHNKPALIRDLLPQLLPQLYVETIVRKELIREVEMGPFKHSVDDGLDLRKAAFECMYTLLESCLDRLDLPLFLTHVENGLRDHYDIKMLTYLMVGRLSILAPGQVGRRLEKLVEPLRVTVLHKVKTNSVKQEYEKQDELRRAALRALSALTTIPDADKHIPLMEFLTHIRNTPELSALFESVQSDVSGSLQTSEQVTQMDLN